MIHEKSSGAVVFRRDSDGKILYLLLKYHYKSDYYDFPRGNVEEGESEEEAAKREIKEETGLDVNFIGDFREVVSWFYRREGEVVNKKVIFFLAEAKTGEVKISEEHIGYEWLPFEEAMDKLNFENSKNTLRKAQDFLFNRYKSSLRRWTR
ncbi:MAG: NUDIX domain-containing protein [Candidatus Aenigmarchaeota archaeon]|nr:NUDIX domain-containing protein [Candidatus Aenigmarchaeota archaeon]